MDKWLKRIWFVNGVLVLIVTLLFLSDRVQKYLQSGPRPVGPLVGESIKDARKDSLAIQDIVTTIPRRIGATAYTYVTLISKDLEKAINISAYLEAESAGKRGPSPMALVRVVPESEERNSLSGNGTINLAFISDDGSDIRLVTQQKACVVRADIPQPGDTLQKFILYRIVFHDTNGDGRLTDRDESGLYISDLNGLNLRPVTPDSIIVRELVKSFRRDKLVFRGQSRPHDPSIPQRDWREQVYTYDLRTGNLAELLPDERVLNLARKILWGK
ncbi:MAG TPA: hypothetical protein VGB89_01495 [Bacteroidota bacterium]